VNKSNIKWTGKELTTKEHYGALKFSKANLEYENEKLVGGEFVVDMTTLDVQDLSGRGKERLEGHLRSDDFFSVDKHNNAYLKITDLLYNQVVNALSDHLTAVILRKH
jgi:polyisoprenoid-binding protein YceI